MASVKTKTPKPYVSILKRPEAMLNDCRSKGLSTDDEHAALLRVMDSSRYQGALKAKLELEYVNACGAIGKKESTFLYNIYRIARSSLKAEDRLAALAALEKHEGIEHIKGAETAFIDHAVTFVRKSRDTKKVKESDRGLLAKMLSPPAPKKEPKKRIKAKPQIEPPKPIQRPILMDVEPPIDIPIRRAEPATSPIPDALSPAQPPIITKLSGSWDWGLIALGSLMLAGAALLTYLGLKPDKFSDLPLPPPPAAYSQSNLQQGSDQQVYLQPTPAPAYTPPSYSTAAAPSYPLVEVVVVHYRGPGSYLIGAPYPMMWHPRYGFYP